MFNKACKKPLIKGLFILKKILMVFIALCGFLLCIHNANAQTKSLKLYYVHTGQKAEIAFKKNGQYIDSGLKQLNYFLRDWRRNEPTKMDPRLFDLIWQVYRNSGSRDYIHVVSAYRSPATNNMLRSRSASSGVAKNSQHTLGRAMDFYLPDVSLAKLRQIGLKQQVGGVGYYPTSGSPFVHMDIGSVRHWPRMGRSELLALFPNGKTIHIPSDGKPLNHYNEAMAEYKARKGQPSQTVLVQDERTQGGFFARLFGNKQGQSTQQQQQTIVAVSRPQITQPQRPQIIPLEADQEAIDDMIDLPNSNDAPIPITSPIHNQETPVLSADKDIKPLETKNDLNHVIAQNNYIPIPNFKPNSNIFVAQTTQQMPDNPDNTTNAIKNNDQQAQPTNASSDMMIAYTIPVPVMRNKYSKIIKNGDKIAAEITNTNNNTAPQQITTNNKTIKKTDDIHKIINNNSELIPLPEEDIDRDIAVASITPAKNQKNNAAISYKNNDILAKKNNEDNETNKELLQIPTIVFASSIKKGKINTGGAKLTGRAINFQAIAHLNR